MTDVLLWLLTVEALGLAAFPLACFLFRALPDRGYGLTKPLGILLVAFLNWWLGSVAGVANYPVLLWLLAILLCGGGLLLFRYRLVSVPEDRMELGLTILVEEAVFLVAFAFWTYVRSRNPDIYGTEKPMDMMLLQVSGMAHHFPPPDAWLSGHTVNYYYLGYAIFAMIGNMAGVDSRFGFNLSNITIFALGCSGGYALTLGLTRSRLWGFAGAFAVMLAGNLDGFFQVTNQVFNGGINLNGLNLWCSTRVLDTPHVYSGASVDCPNYLTITEFPIFSMLWNDLHPHVMALPFALLAIGLAVHAMLDTPTDDREVAHYLRLVVLAVLLGALFPINSWDYPTYLLLTMAALTVSYYRHDLLTTRRCWEVAALLPASLLFYLPYFLTVHNRTAIGLNRHPSDLGEVLTVVGGLLLPLVIYVAYRFGAALIAQNADEEREPNALSELFSSLPPGSGWWLLAAWAFILFAVPGRANTLELSIIAAAGYVIWTRMREEEAADLMVLGLALAGALLLLLGDYVYLRDNFDNSPSYRMNTVFKLYYQTWLLLAAGAPYGVAAIVRALWPRYRGLLGAWAALAALLAMALAGYPIEGVASQGVSMASTPGLDGLAYLALRDPEDYNTIDYIRKHLPSDAVIAEADGSAMAGDAVIGSCIEYWVCDPSQAIFNRISALTGRPTLIGWPGSHEDLWRGVFGDSPDTTYSNLIHQREADVRTLYTTSDPSVAMAIIRRDGVRYVYVGPLEHSVYVDRMHNPPSVLTKFNRFLKPVFTQQGAVLYEVP
jgi:YYY domain-containing protein